MLNLKLFLFRIFLLVFLFFYRIYLLIVLKSNKKKILSNYEKAFPLLKEKGLRSLFIENKSSIVYSYFFHVLINYMKPKEIDYFLKNYVSCKNDSEIDSLISKGKSFILATPHSGTYLIGLLYLAKFYKSTQHINVFFDDPKNNKSNKMYADLINKHSNGKIKALFNNKKSLISAIKGLKNGDILCMLPDVFTEKHFHVPFFNSHIKTMGGTSFFSIKTNVPIIPAFCYPNLKTMNITLKFDSVILNTYKNLDNEIQIKLLTMELYWRLEKQFKKLPSFWIYWDTFNKLSTNFPPSSFNQENSTINISHDFLTLVAKVQPDYFHIIKKSSLLVGGESVKPN